MWYTQALSISMWAVNLAISSHMGWVAWSKTPNSDGRPYRTLARALDLGAPGPFSSCGNTYMYNSSTPSTPDLGPA